MREKYREGKKERTERQEQTKKEEKGRMNRHKERMKETVEDSAISL